MSNPNPTFEGTDVRTNKKDAAYLRTLAESLLENQWPSAPRLLVAIADRLDPLPKMVMISWEQVACVEPKVGDTYYVITTGGEVLPGIWSGSVWEYNCFAMGNVYPTEADARAAQTARKAAVAKVMA